MSKVPEEPHVFVGRRALGCSALMEFEVLVRARERREIYDQTLSLKSYDKLREANLRTDIPTHICLFMAAV